MERKIGETFLCNGKFLKTVEGNADCSCTGCFFYDKIKCEIEIAGPCMYTYRSDNKDVKFVECHDEYIHIQIPDGYEIDTKKDNEIILKRTEQILPETWEDCLCESGKKPPSFRVGMNCLR